MKKSLIFAFVLLLAGCSSMRHYKFAGPKESAGDIVHASEPGAKVVVPKKP